jgi:hypothetical protein
VSWDVTGFSEFDATSSVAVFDSAFNEVFRVYFGGDSTGATVGPFAGSQLVTLNANETYTLAFTMTGTLDSGLTGSPFASFTIVPLPTTSGLAAVGLLGLGGVRRRRA